MTISQRETIFFLQLVTVLVPGMGNNRWLWWYGWNKLHPFSTVGQLSGGKKNTTCTILKFTCIHMSLPFMDGYTRLHISFIFQQQNLCLHYVIDYHLYMFPSSRKTKYLHWKMLHQSRGLPKISMISPTPTLPQVSCGSIHWSLVSKLWDAVLQLRYTDTLSWNPQPLKIGHPEKEISSTNHPFSGAKY